MKTAIRKTGQEEFVDDVLVSRIEKLSYAHSAMKDLKVQKALASKILEILDKIKVS